MFLGTHAARRTGAWNLLSAALALVFLAAGPRQVLAAAPAWDYVYFPDTQPENAPAGAWGSQHNPGQDPVLAGGRLSFNLNSNAKFYYRDATMDPNFPTPTLTFEWKVETLSAGYFDMGVYSSAGETSDLIFDGFFSRSDNQVLEFFTFFNAGSLDLPPLLGKGQRTYRIVRGPTRADLYVDGVLQATLPASGSLIDEVYLHVASFYANPPNYTALWDHVAYTRGAYTPEELPSPTRGGNNGPESLVAVSALTSSAPVSTQLASPLVVETRNASNLPLGDVPVEFSITSAPPGATGFQFVAKENRTNPAGRASSGFLLGNLPLEYNIKVDCPSCAGSANSVAFRICGELPGELYRQNVNKPGKQDYIRDRLANSADPADSIEHYGCTLTAYTMLLNIFRSRYNLTYPDSTPGTLNSALTPSGFSPVARLNLPVATPLFAGNQVRYVDAYNVGIFTSYREVMTHVDDSLKLGNPALVRLQSTTGALGHFVTVTGRCGSRYRVLDPYTGTDYSYIDLDDLGTKVILGVRIFER